MGRVLRFQDYDNADELYESSSKLSNRPFWALINDRSIVGSDREDAIRKWLNEVIEALLDFRQPIVDCQKLNTLLYKGKHYKSQRASITGVPLDRRDKESKNFLKIVVNHLHRATEQHVADLTAYEPALTVVPRSNEEIDKVAARMFKDIIDFYFDETDIKVRFQTLHRRTKVHGETFLFVIWDKDAGDYHPVYEQWRRAQREMGQDPDMPVPLVNPETGEPLLDERNNPLLITEPIRAGDISIQSEYAWNVLYPYVESCEWEDVPYIIRLKWHDIDEIKAQYPKASDKIKNTEGRSTYPPKQRALHDQVLVRYMWHKPTKFLNAGYYCVSTEDVILESGPYPYNHGHLPVIRGTDIDVPGELSGMSFYQNLVTLQHAINNSTSMILQNQSLFAYPKYMSPRGAKVSWRELDDDRGIIEYSGPRPPEIMAASSTPPDSWRWRDTMKEEFQSLSAIFATSEGRAPNGITANVALRMIDEQERRLHKPAIDKHANNVEKLGTLILAVLGTYRTPDDGALIKILGRNQERYLRYFDESTFSRPYEVKILKSSGLPDTPAARTQMVLDLDQARPGMFSNEEFLSMLDVKRPEKLIESATVSREAAESEVEDILQGMVNVPPPMAFDDILPKYRVYEKAVQSRAFKEADPVIQSRMFNHIITAEYLMWRKSTLNPHFQQKIVMEHPNFPMFFPMPKPSPEPFVLATGVPPTMPMGLMPINGGPPPLAGVPPEMAGPGAPGPQEPPILPDQGMTAEPSPMPQPDIPANELP